MWLSCLHDLTCPLYSVPVQSTAGLWPTPLSSAEVYLSVLNIPCWQVTEGVDSLAGRFTALPQALAFWPWKPHYFTTSQPPWNTYTCWTHPLPPKPTSHDWFLLKLFMIPKANYHLPSSDFVPLLCGLSQMPSFSLGALHTWLNLLAWLLCKDRDCVLVDFLVLHGWCPECHFWTFSSSGPY